MVRPTSPLLLLLTLALGISLGLNSRPRRPDRLGPGPPPAAAGLAERGRRARPRPRSGSGGQGEDGDLRPARPPVRPVRARQPDVRAGRQGGLAVGRPPRRPQGRASARTSRTSAEFEETGSGVIVRGEGAEGLFVLTNNHVVAGAAAGQIDIFLQRRPVVPPVAGLARQQGRHRRPQARPRRPARRPARQQRRRGGRLLGPGDGQPVRPDPLGQPGDHQRPGAARGRPREGRASRTRTSSRPTPRSTRATRAGRW